MSMFPYEAAILILKVVSILSGVVVKADLPCESPTRAAFVVAGAVLQSC